MGLLAATTRLLRRFSGSEFARDVATVASGTAMVQLIGLMATPLVTRLYGPEAYGLLGAWTAVLAVAGPLSALSYPAAIALAESDEDAVAIAQLALAVSVTVSSVALIVGVAWYGSVADAFGLQGASWAVYAIPFAMVLVALDLVCTQLLYRKRDFRSVARRGVAQSILLHLVRLIAGVLKPSGGTLVATALFGAVASPVFVVPMLRRYFGPVRHDVKRLSRLASQFADFPKFRAPQDLLNSLSQNAPTVVLGLMYGPAAAGYFALSRVVLGLPISLIGVSFSSVLYHRIARGDREGEDVRRILLRMTLTLGCVGLPVFIPIAVAGPRLFEMVFGHGWARAGFYAQMLSPFLYLQLVNRAAVAAIPTLSLQKWLLGYEIVSTFLKLLALYVGLALLRSDAVSLALFSGVGAICYLWLIARVVSQTKDGRRRTDA